MTDAQSLAKDRRPIASRRLRIMQDTARWLTQSGVSPNAISVSSMVFAAAAGGCLVATATALPAWRLVAGLGAACFMQLRLLANLFDGMVAVEGGKGSPVGGIYNEAPDRVSDSLILIGAGFACGGNPLIGCLAALAALFTAYVRALGASCGTGQVFLGPMAKPQRMCVMTLIALYLAVAPADWLNVTAFGTRLGIMAIVLGVIAGLCLVTAWRRLRRICTLLNDKAHAP